MREHADRQPFWIELKKESAPNHEDDARDQGGGSGDSSSGQQKKARKDQGAEKDGDID